MLRPTASTAAALLGIVLLAPAPLTLASSAAASADVEFCGSSPATIVGTSPTVVGTPGPDVVVTGAATRVDTLGGDDVVCVRSDRPGTGVVSVTTGDGDDGVVIETSRTAGASIEAGEGVDSLVAASRAGRLTIDLELDVLGVDDVAFPASGLERVTFFAPTVEMTGDEGDDYLSWDGCDAIVRSGAGDDVLINRFDDYFESYTYDCTGRVAMNGGDGSDILRGSVSDDRLVGGRGHDRLEGRGGNDRLRGGAGNDELDGGERRDNLSGGGGNDVMRGRASGDTLIGGGGRDLADGSRGRDLCRAERERRCER